MKVWILNWILNFSMSDSSLYCLEFTDFELVMRSSNRAVLEMRLSSLFSANKAFLWSWFKGRMCCLEVLRGAEKSSFWAFFKRRGPARWRCGLQSHDCWTSWEGLLASWWLLLASSWRNFDCSIGSMLEMELGRKQSFSKISSLMRCISEHTARCIYRQLFDPPWLAIRNAYSWFLYEAVLVKELMASAGSAS